MSKLSFISSNDRKYNVSRALALIKSDITSGLKSAKNVVLKPNCIVSDYQLAATHANAIEAVLEFICPHVNSQIILAEGTTKGDTLEAFKKYNYFDIQERFDLALVDLNDDETELIELLDPKGNIYNAFLPKTILNADYFISVSPPKTNFRILFDATISNIFPSSFFSSKDTVASKLAKSFGISSNKKLSPELYSYLHHNIIKLFKKRQISLSIIDGFSSMQGNGPEHEGQTAATHWAIASVDPIAADILACRLLGIDIEPVKYLYELYSEHSKSEDIIVGDEWKNRIIEVKLPDNFQ